MTELNTAPQLAPHERCTGCAACEPNCPFGVPIAQRMEETAALFGA